MEDIKTILFKIGYSNLKDLGGEYQTRPLYRDSDNNTALVIQKDTGLYYDFVERAGGNLTQLIQRTLKLSDYNEAEKILVENGFQPEVKTNDYKSLIISQKTFDKSMLSKLRRDHSYWNNRGITNKTITQFDGGTTFNGRMSNRYVFPVFNSKDELVGFAGRNLNDNTEFPKWCLIGKKKDWVYPAKLNENIILEKKSVILVESIGNMLALYECGIKNVLVTFGVSLGQKIIEFLLKIDVKRIIIGLDNDSENNSVGNKAAIEMKKELLNYFDENQIETITPKYKDWNEFLIKDKNGLEEFCKESNL